MLINYIHVKYTKKVLVGNDSLPACIEEGISSLLTFPGYSTSVWCISGCLLWFWFVELKVGTLGNVSLCSLLVEAAWAVGALDIIRVIWRWGRRKIRQFPSPSHVGLHLFCSTNTVDEIFMFLAPVCFLYSLQWNSEQCGLYGTVLLWSPWMRHPEVL